MQETQIERFAQAQTIPSVYWFSFFLFPSHPSPTPQTALLYSRHGEHFLGWSERYRNFTDVVDNRGYLFLETAKCRYSLNKHMQVLCAIGSSSNLEVVVWNCDNCTYVMRMCWVMYVNLIGYIVFIYISIYIYIYRERERERERKRVGMNRKVKYCPLCESNTFLHTKILQSSLSDQEQLYIYIHVCVRKYEHRQ